MNLSEIRTEARRLLAETSATLSYLSDTDLNKFINEGLREACIKAKAYERSKTITVATTIATYNLPWDFIETINLLNHNGRPLDLIMPQMVGSLYTVTGYPLYYTIGQTLTTIAARGNLTLYAIWPATGVYTLTYVVPAAANGYIYEATIGGTTAAAPPAYPTTIGGTVTDGTVTWTCRELFSSLKTITLFDTPTVAGAGTGTYTYIYSALEEGLYVDTDSPNIPLDKHSFISQYACFRACVKGKDLQLAMAFYTGFANGFGLPMIGAEGAKSAT
jgi:hypothetical protein